jgi:SET domain-containing protein
LDDSLKAGGDPATVLAGENSVISQVGAHSAYGVRQSSVHGYGAFATRDIAEGEVVDEYAGERITHAQANERYEDDDPENVDEIYACRCGSPKCRGTILWPAKRPKPRVRKTRRA